MSKCKTFGILFLCKHEDLDRFSYLHWCNLNSKYLKVFISCHSGLKLAPNEFLFSLIWFSWFHIFFLFDLPYSSQFYLLIWFFFKLLLFHLYLQLPLKITIVTLDVIFDFNDSLFKLARAGKYNLRVGALKYKLEPGPSNTNRGRGCQT